MRVVSIGDLVLDYYYKNGKLIGVDGGMSSHNIIANLAKKKISTAIYGVSGNDIQGKIANLSLKKLNVDVSKVLIKDNIKTRCFHVSYDEEGFISKKRCPKCPKCPEQNMILLNWTNQKERFTNDFSLF